MTNEAPKSLLEEITTRWGVLADPMQFVLRYGPALRAYLHVLVPHSHDAEDVLQDFLLRVIRQPLSARQASLQHRFRDYLKAALRNAAVDFHRKRNTKLQRTAQLPEDIATPQQENEAERVWAAQWRAILLDRTWDVLESHERKHGGYNTYTVLRLAADHPERDSPALAEQLSRKVGHEVSAVTFRKQLSRARRLFAKLLLHEVRQTLEQPTQESLNEELRDLELTDYLKGLIDEEE